jgi:membrane protease YdiL (CAAX protease family)
MPSDNPLTLQLADLALFVASLFIWAITIRRLRIGREVARYEPRRPVPWQGVDLAFILLSCMLLVGLVSKATGWLEEPRSKASGSDPSEVAQQVHHEKPPSEKEDSQVQPLSTRDLTTTLIVELLAAAFAIGWVTYRVRAMPRDLGFGLSHLRSDLGLGALAFLAAYLPVMGLQALLKEFIPYDHPLIESLKVRPDALTLALTGVSAVLVAPLFEELFFRVLLQGCLEAVEAKRRWLLMNKLGLNAALTPPQSGDNSPGPAGGAGLQKSHIGATRPIATDAELVATSGPAAWPIVLTSLLFGLVHRGQGAAPVPLFILSLFLGYVYQRTHRIWPSLIAHMLLNGITMAALWYLIMNQAK